MITLRQMSAAFLFYEDKLLLLEKPQNNSFISGMIVPVGGHLEQREINSPSEACLREIEEETGLTSKDLTGLELRYIMLRIKETEIRVQYVFFSHVKHMVVRESEEGKLSWTDVKTVTELKVTATTRYILEHYFENKNPSGIYVGTMKSDGNDPAITWALLDDWEN